MNENQLSLMIDQIKHLEFDSIFQTSSDGGNANTNNASNQNPNTNSSKKKTIQEKKSSPKNKGKDQSENQNINYKNNCELQQPSISRRSSLSSRLSQLLDKEEEIKKKLAEFDKRFGKGPKKVDNISEAKKINNYDLNQPFDTRNSLLSNNQMMELANEGTESEISNSIVSKYNYNRESSSRNYGRISKDSRIKQSDRLYDVSEVANEGSLQNTASKAKHNSTNNHINPSQKKSEWSTFQEYQFNNDAPLELDMDIDYEEDIHEIEEIQDINMNYDNYEDHEITGENIENLENVQNINNMQELENWQVFDSNSMRSKKSENDKVRKSKTFPIHNNENNNILQNDFEINPQKDLHDIYFLNNDQPIVEKDNKKNFTAQKYGKKNMKSPEKNNNKNLENKTNQNNIQIELDQEENDDLLCQTNLNSHFSLYNNSEMVKSQKNNFKDFNNADKKNAKNSSKKSFKNNSNNIDNISRQKSNDHIENLKTNKYLYNN